MWWSDGGGSLHCREQLKPSSLRLSCCKDSRCSQGSIGQMLLQACNYPGRVHALSCLTLYCCSVTKSCLTLWVPMDYRPPGSSVCGIFQARNTRVGCQFPTLGDLPSPGIEHASLVSPGLAVGLFTKYLTFCGQTQKHWLYSVATSAGVPHLISAFMGGTFGRMVHLLFVAADLEGTVMKPGCSMS